ncbi:MAG: flavodoxin family protein [Eubacterium sp.]|nr:flavodoxin family protein [Eubacterium sp.]
MKVVALNGSPRKNGNTYLSLKAACDVLNAEGIETEILSIGSLKLTGCRACGGCAKLGKCVIDDGLNELAEKTASADWLIVGSPVYYADINGTLKCFLDRFFYVNSAKMRFKPCAALVVLRRSGVTHAYQTIYNYFTIAEMLITPTSYWPGIHGRLPGEAEQDLEGISVARGIGRNMAYLLKLREGSTLPIPEPGEKVIFNYIR